VPSWLHDGLPAVLRETGGLAHADSTCSSSRRSGSRSKASSSPHRDGNTLAVREGSGDGAVVALDGAAFAELMQDVTRRSGS